MCRFGLMIWEGISSLERDQPSMPAPRDWAGAARFIFLMGFRLQTKYREARPLRVGVVQLLMEVRFFTDQIRSIRVGRRGTWEWPMEGCWCSMERRRVRF